MQKNRFSPAGLWSVAEVVGSAAHSNQWSFSSPGKLQPAIAQSMMQTLREFGLRSRLVNRASFEAEPGQFSLCVEGIFIVV